MHELPDHERPSAEAHTPTLGYASPVGRPPPKFSRREAIRDGWLYTWLWMFACVAISCGTRSALWLLALPVAIILLFTYGIRSAWRDRNGGFLLGVFFGVLTVAGLAALLVVVTCGNRGVRFY